MTAEVKINTEEIERAVSAAIRKTEAEFTAKIKEWSGYTMKLHRILSEVDNAIEKIQSIGNLPEEMEPITYRAPMASIKEKVEPPRAQLRGTQPDTVIIDEVDTTSNLGAMGGGERKILIAVASDAEGITRNHITILTGYKITSRNEYIRRLKLRGYVEVRAENIIATQEGIEELGNDYEQLPTGQELQNHLMRTLPIGEKKILEVLLENYPGIVSREEISEQTGYKITSRNEYLRRLNTRRLVAIEGASVKAVDNLFL